MAEPSINIESLVRAGMWLKEFSAEVHKAGHIWYYPILKCKDNGSLHVRWELSDRQLSVVFPINGANYYETSLSVGYVLNVAPMNKTTNRLALWRWVMYGENS